MSDHLYPFEAYYKMNDHLIDGFEDPEDGLLKVRQTIMAQCANLADKEIVKAIVDTAREEGVTDLYLIDKEFILRAIRNELERMKDEK